MAFPLFPALEVRSLVVRSKGPAAVRVIPTRAEQVALGPTVPPVREIVFPPSGALNVPPQLLVAMAGSVKATPLGKLSVKPRLFAAIPLLFWISKVSSAQLPIPTVSDDILREKEGGCV